MHLMHRINHSVLEPGFRVACRGCAKVLAVIPGHTAT
jgi:hypothetical protein